MTTVPSRSDADMLTRANSEAKGRLIKLHPHTNALRLRFTCCSSDCAYEVIWTFGNAVKLEADDDEQTGGSSPAWRATTVNSHNCTAATPGGANLMLLFIRATYCRFYAL